MQSQSAGLVNILEVRLAGFGITRDHLLDYTKLLSGQVGRLVFSMLYFIVLVRTLSLGDLGIFASCSAIGIMLSRLLGFGFISPLFRVATTKPVLIGAYTGGFLLAAALSLAPILTVAYLIFWALYASLIPLQTFLFIVMAEVVCWRALETTIIVCNGQDRYLTGSLLAIGGVAAKAAAAATLFMLGGATLPIWAEIYAVVLFAVALAAAIVFYPKQRLRWKPKAWIGRSRDALGVSTAETLFQIQSEMDKVLVLALGGEVLAGLYAIVMRLVDLTAMPLRALSTMLTKWIMRTRRTGNGAKTGLMLDLLIGVTSVGMLAALALFLSFFPAVLGKNIVLGVSFLWLVLLVPAFRNAIELHTDLLYGHQKMAARVWLLVYVGTLKAVLLTALLNYTTNFATVAIWLNVVFAALYGASALVTYVRVLDHADMRNQDKN